MFYVSDISGSQTPYLQEIARLQREVSIEQTAALLSESDLGAQELSAIESSRIQSGATGIPSTTQIGKSSTSGEASSIATGTAGASMLHKGKEGQATSNSDSTSPEQAPPRQRHAPHKQKVSQVQSIAGIKKDPSDSVEFDTSSPSTNPYTKLDASNPQREKALLASQIMSSPVETLYKNDSQKKASKLFHERRFRHVPVVTKNNLLIGIVSDRDFFSQKDPESLVENMMTTNVLTARPTTEIRHIAQVLFEERIGAMPIVDEAGELVGMVTRSDILRTVVNKAPLELWL